MLLLIYYFAHWVFYLILQPANLSFTSGYQIISVVKILQYHFNMRNNYQRHLAALFLVVVSINISFAQTKMISATYTYDGKKYPLQMEVTDWKAVFNQNKTTAYTPSGSGSSAPSAYRMPGSLRRLHNNIERLRATMQQAADKKQRIDEQLDNAYSMVEAGDYELAQGLLQTKELREAQYTNYKYPLLDFLCSAGLGLSERAFLLYLSNFCYSDYDAAGKKIPGTSKSFIVDDPGTRAARYVQDRYTEKQLFEVELAFSSLLLQKSKSEYYNTQFGNETALIHLNKAVAYFEKKGFAIVADPIIIFLYETCGDAVKANNLFNGVIQGQSVPNNVKYQLCKYIISKAPADSKLLKSAVESMRQLFDAAKNNDEKIITRLELLKGSIALGDIAIAINYGLDLVIALPQKSVDYCAVTYLLGKIEQSQQHYAAAIVQYKYVVYFSPDPELKKSALSETAGCYADSGDVKNALLTYQELYTQNPDKFTANECISFYISAKEFQLAESLLSQTLKEDPLFYISLLNYGDLLVATGKPKKAREYYVKASNQSSDLSEAQRKVIADYK